MRRLSLFIFLILSCSCSIWACENIPQEISKSVELNSSCEYSGNYIISTSNIIFDCKGAVINGGNAVKFGIRIDSNGMPLENVIVRNCIVKNFSTNGVWIGWGKPDRDKVDLYDSKEQLYERTPKNIKILNTKIQDSGRVGIYVDDYASHVLIKNSEVSGSGGVGLYLEHSSKYNEVIENKFFGNGAGKREQIAVDSSANNIISNNVIDVGAVGGIFLYKNCYERYRSDQKSVPRWQHSTGNLIKNNIFHNGGVGVWIASRQSRNLRGFECGDPPVYGDFIFRDFAEKNIVENNEFINLDGGIIVEDHDNLIKNNVFSKISGTAIKIGSKYLYEVLREPVRGVQLLNNNYMLDVRKNVELVYGARVVNY